MSNAVKVSEDFYTELYDTFMAIPQAEHMSMNMPQEEVVAEGETLAIISTEDSATLTGAGINPEYISSLNARVGAFAYAAAQFDVLFDGEAEAKKQWREKSPQGYDLKRKLLHVLGFAYRNDPELLKSIREVKDGRGNKDMILDLLSIYILGSNNKGPLEAINFDQAELDSAKALHEDLSDILARATVDQGKVNEKKTIRDAAYTYLKEAVDEIKSYSEYVFYDNPDRLDLYLSDYRQKLGKMSHKRAPESDPVLMQDN